MGTIERIWIKRAKRGPMDARAEADLVAGRGILGNANQGGQRQVTLIEREAWERMFEELGAVVALDTRRANLLVSGISLADSRGKTMRIGSCLLLVRGETRPCERMEEAYPGLRRAMSPEWRGGCYAEVLEGGRIAVGDEVVWVAVGEG